MPVHIPALTDEQRRQAPRAVSPTDISQFIRLDQCQRYLRLRLHERDAGRTFLYDYDVAPQAIPPILTRSGATFEQAVERAIGAMLPSHRFTDAERRAAGRDNDNSEVVSRLADLPAGQALVLFQPRLQAAIGNWDIRGDIDLLRLERDASGNLRALIADIKSTTTAKVEHRLQVAFYHEILGQVLAEAGTPQPPIEMAILYRGPAEEQVGGSIEDTDRHARQHAAACDAFGVDDGLLEFVEKPAAYIEAVRDLVTGPNSTASRVLGTPFADIPFHLTYKCDGCVFNEFCMKQAAESDDLSLLPHLTEQDKTALHQHGITTTRELALLKEMREGKPVQVNGVLQPGTRLVPAPGRERLSRALAATWPVGPRLDELIYRARSYRKFKKDDIAARRRLPSRGYTSLPYSDATQNANMVRVYIDAQHDYLHDRIYMLGALVVASETGVERPHRRRSIVHLTDGPPTDTAIEERLFVDWIAGTLRAVADVAAPDPDGALRAPIHLVFINDFAQRVLLEGLARHAGSILGATALYDLVTQLAAFDSPIASYLEREIRDHRNYPMTCQSLQAVAAFLKFDWNRETPYRDVFRERLFDFWGTLRTVERPLGDWYTNRARFNSQIPVEYAYAAWNQLDPPAPGQKDEMAPFRPVTPALLTGFHARRLEAMEHIAHDIPGNRQTTHTPFDLSDLATFEQQARTFAQALDEFVTIERHVELTDWRRSHQPEPEQRVLNGITFVARYVEADQDPDVAAANRENERRRLLHEQLLAVTGGELSKAQKEETKWSGEGLQFRLRLEMADVDCSLDEALGLSTLRPSDRLVMLPRFDRDSRLAPEAQFDYTPTPKQLLYGMGATLDRLEVERDHGGSATRAWLEITMNRPRNPRLPRGFAFNTPWYNNLPLRDDLVYTLDEDPNSFYGYWQAKVTEGLVAGGRNVLYDLLTRAHQHAPAPAEAAVAGQRRFLAGLDALHAAGALHGFEESKRDYIGGYGAAPLLLVQGPPGTGKSYSTAFAVLARIQGAMASDRDYRVILSCKTHAATDVLVENLWRVQQRLREIARDHPTIFAGYFDPRLLTVPLSRYRPKQAVPEGIVPIPDDGDVPKGAPKAWETITAARWGVAGMTTGGVYKLQNRWPKALFDKRFIDCVVLDEASQMSIPEAVMATLPLKDDGVLIVVGDHRQMPPIVKNDWSNEKRRTFQLFRSYESLFLALLPLQPPMIRFAESFRLHADMAEFLRREVYQYDGIRYHSRRHDVLPAYPHRDDFLAAVLAPAHPLTVVVHNEAQSQHRNHFEQALMEPLLEALADPARYGLDAVEGLGVVVPHRAQRAALQEAVPALVEIDEETGAIVHSAVDTVERFQGGERTAILIGATESDREYLLLSGEFLLNPQRLTVALSRARRKLVLVASRSVFEVFSADEDLFEHAQMWKNLLRRTCTVPLWTGDRHGTAVEVWGNAPTPPASPSPVGTGPVPVRPPVANAGA